MNQYYIGFIRCSDWMVDSRGIFLEHEGTGIQVLLRVKFNIMILNVAMVIYFDAAGFRVHVSLSLSPVTVPR